MTSHIIAGIGVDVVEVSDMKKIRFKKRFAEYFLTAREMRSIPAGRGVAQYLASRFALKEAVIKAFPGKLSPLDFYVEKNGPRPGVVFVHPARNKKYFVHVSITHTARIAAAVALVHAR